MGKVLGTPLTELPLEKQLALNSEIAARSFANNRELERTIEKYEAALESSDNAVNTLTEWLMVALGRLGEKFNIGARCPDALLAKERRVARRNAKYNGPS